MADHPIREHRSLQIAHHLMNFYQHTIGFLLFEAERFVPADRSAPIAGSSTRAPPSSPFGPFDLRMQQRQGRLEVATVEGSVGSL